MALKTGIATLVLGTLLFGSSALAQDGSVRDWARQEGTQRQNERRDENNNARDNDRRDYDRDDDDRRGNDRRDNDGDWTRRRDDDRRRGGYRGDRYVEVHVHGHSCRHDPAPQPPPRAPRGRYELQTVSRWEEGRYERVWVPEVCKEKYRRHSRVTKCTGGYYEQSWVPGRYVQTQEWVWVTYGNDDGWRSRRAHPASHYP